MSKKKKLKVASFDDNLHAMLQTKAGQSVLWEIINRTGLVAPDLFTGNSTTFYNMGKRDLGVELYNDIMAVDPRKFIEMQLKQLDEEKEEDHGRNSTE